ncbi:protein FAM184B isoform X3 [Pelobates fuscus]|uniref:protein FAM184B isoform X3 n=1 Tax=Pelobates fuscus TaxID=191477 RepID=UPI002FE4D3B7
MASGKYHQPGTYNGCKANQLVSQEYTQELHFKMCKKIAQLTKVIHALNHKIDEYEVNILALKETHQQEIDLISAETLEKCLQYDKKIEEEESLRLRILSLEESLEKNNLIKEQSLADFDTYKKQTEESELKTKAEHDEKVAALSNEIQSMKNDYENHLKKLTEEADSLRNECKSCKKDRPSDNVTKQLNKEIDALSKEVEKLKSQQKMLTEEYARKVGNLHSSYSKERESLRKALQQSVTDMIQQLQQKEQEQKRCVQAKEDAMLQEVKQLKGEIDTKTQEIVEITKHSQKMKEKIQEFETQLSKKGQELTDSKSIQGQLEEELNIAKQRLLLQEKEIHSQTEQIQALSSTRKAYATELAELKSQYEKQQLTCSNGNNNGEVVTLKQEESSQNLLRVRNDELEESKRELSRLKMENSDLKSSVDQHSKENAILQLEVLNLTERQNKITKDLRLKQKTELDVPRHSHQQEIQTLVSNFSSAQALLQARVISLEADLKDMEDRFAKHPRPEDLKLIKCLQDKIAEKDQVIKHLLELKEYDMEDDVPFNSETHRSQSFSCNAGSLTPTLKQKKKIGEIPTRVISVPNLAAYEKNLMNHDIIPRKIMNPIRNSPSLDQSVKHGYPFKPPAQLLNIIRPSRHANSRQCFFKGRLFRSRTQEA